MTAIVPAAPLGPSSLLFVNSVVIKWSLATLDSQTAYGSEIRGFKVMIRWLDGTYGEELTHCDGSNAVVMAETKCTIPV